MLIKKFFPRKKIAEVTFIFSRERVESVSLLGDFNKWESYPMKYNRKDKNFRIKICLPLEQAFQFRYLLDSGEWENDCSADDYIPNEFGTINSVVVTESH